MGCLDLDLGRPRTFCAPSTMLPNDNCGKGDEAAAAQLSLLSENPTVYGPVMAKQREAAALAQQQMAAQQQQ